MDRLERRVDIGAGLGSCQDDLARREDQQTDLGVLHVVDQARKGVRVEVTKHLVLALEQALELNLKVDRARTNHVLHLEVRQLHIVSDLLDGLRVLLSRVKTVLLTLSPSDHHFSGFKNQRRRSLGLLHPHDDGRKTLWIVLGISALKRNVFQIQLTAQIGGRNQVLKFGRLVLGHLRSLASLAVARGRGAHKLAARLHHLRRCNVISWKQARLRD